jgi:N-acetylmuramic acid 6-phosphate etherase
VSATPQAFDRGHLLTEQPNPASEALDELDTDELVALFCENELETQQAVAAAAAALAAAIDAIAQRLSSGGRLFYLGAGTSGRLGVLDAAECPPTFCTPPELVQGVLAGGAPALLRSSEGLEDLFDAGPRRTQPCPQHRSPGHRPGLRARRSGADALRHRHSSAHRR